MSQFDWTDRDCIRWFILLPTGHQGPYALKNLEILVQKSKLKPEASIWAEGLAAPLSVKEALSKAEPVVEPPPMPIVEEAPIPDVPKNDEQISVEEVLEPKKVTIPVIAFFSVLGILVIFFILNNVLSEKEKISIRRMPKMTVELHNRIQKENVFDGWRKQIFFREYLPQDHSQIWLITSGFQRCDIDATFTSIPEKILSMKEDQVSFKTQGKLDRHIVEFSQFDFTKGRKIVPGLYEMDLKASRCEWGSLLANALNGFAGPDSTYVARTRVILYSKGAEAFNKNLETLLKKKYELALREKNAKDLFWQDLQQKFETLEAITLQIEQLFLDHLGDTPDKFMKEIKLMVSEYTRKFGTFLTAFVVENENYFKGLGPDVEGSSARKNYALAVRLSSKKVGLESMKFIEEFQGLKKKPSPKELTDTSARVKKVFSELKKELTEKLSQVSADRVK